MKSFTGKKIVGVLFFIAIFAGAVAVTMLLWNALVPSIFGWSVVNYWQAAGLLVLSRLLFGGFRGFRRGRWMFDNRHHGEHFEMRQRMKGMSREERREFFRNHMQKNSPFGDVFFDRGFDRERPDGNRPE